MTERFGLLGRFGSGLRDGLGLRSLALGLIMLMASPSPYLWACACSEVAIGQAVISSAMEVDNETGELRLTQSDIDLPGVIPVEVTRQYGSSMGLPSIFGYGWRLEGLAYYIPVDSGGIEAEGGGEPAVGGEGAGGSGGGPVAGGGSAGVVAVGITPEEVEDKPAICLSGRVIYFDPENGYYNTENDMKLVFGEEVIVAESARGEKWTFDAGEKTLTSYEDANGNQVLYEWKTEEVPFWGITEKVYCPTKITYPDGRELLFEYDEAKPHLCTKITSPSGFEVEYSYTDTLLTGISKSNGQVLSYNYFKVVESPTEGTSSSGGGETPVGGEGAGGSGGGPAVGGGEVEVTAPPGVKGWLTGITYANGATIGITYNGQFENQKALRVVEISGPLDYEHTYGYTFFPNEGGSGASDDVHTLTRTDSLGNKTVYGYTRYDKDNPTANRTSTIEDALEQTTTMVKSSTLKLLSLTNRLGKTTTFTYDTANEERFARNNLLTTSNPLGKVWEIEYVSGKIWPNKLTDPLNHEVSMTYDAKGNLLTVVNGLNQTVVTNTYSTTGLKGLLLATTNGAGNTTSFEYNELGLLEKRTDAAGKEWAFGYAEDDSGNLTSLTNPLGKIWTNEYNGFYKPSKVIDPLDNETEFTYDEMANLTEITDAEGNETQFEWDQLQRRTKITNALNNETTFTYDAESNQTNLTDARGKEYSWTYNPLNLIHTFVFPDESEESYQYNANEALTKLTDRDGGEITYAYDDAGRRTQKVWKASTDTVFTYIYDDADKLTSIEKKTGVTVNSSIEYTYNAANQTTSVVAEGRTISFQYDAAQRLSQLTYPSSEVVKYAYNSSRSLTESIKDGGNNVIVGYTFDDAGRVTKEAYANGLESVYEYNDANWMTKITLRETATPANVKQRFEYGYNKVGYRTWVKYLDGTGDVYRYDVTYQLTGVKYGVSNPAAGYDLATGAVKTVTYTYDAVGNRTQTVEDGTVTTNYTVNDLNQYTVVGANSAFSYNDRGDLAGDGTWTYSYDREGHLVGASKSGTTVTYQYDAVGRRIGKNVNGTVTKYVYSGENLIEERDGSDNVIAKYVYAGGIDNPVKVIKGANVYYFQQDALGNITALTDGSGAIFESYTYDVFGTPTIKDGSGDPVSVPATPFLFTGREYDAETGLYHYRTRAYSSALGRFLQPDSIDFKGGDTNLYRYVSNNPINTIDPLGECPILIVPLLILLDAALLALAKFQWDLNFGTAQAVTPIIGIPFTMTGKNYEQLGFAAKYVVDQHELVHQRGGGELEAYKETIRVGEEIMKSNTLNGRELTRKDRMEVSFQISNAHRQIDPD